MNNKLEVIGIDHGWSMMKTISQVFVTGVKEITTSTIDGQRLSSEDAIAEYIASMLLLETDPVFYISYDGVYTTGGTDYYEFRCHR